MNSRDYSWHYNRITQAIRYLESNFLAQPNLDEVAAQLQLSPAHFQRLFTEWAGVSPKRFLQYLTINHLRNRITAYSNLAEASEQSGLSAQSRVYDLFTRLEAVTPQEYKTQGSGIVIAYGFHETPFGRCLIGTTSRGVCWLSFVSGPEDEELSKLTAHWFRSKTQPDQVSTLETVNRIFFQVPDKKQQALSVLVKGTNFQVKVWEALLRIPQTNLVTYEGVAGLIGKPSAQRAVGSAVGANHIAWLIPCHRVIRKSGIIGDYRWGSDRKKSMIGWEMAKGEHMQEV